MDRGVIKNKFRRKDFPNEVLQFLNYELFSPSVNEDDQSIEDFIRKDMQFRTIYKQSPVGIEIYDLEGSLVDINQACLDIFGVKTISEVSGFKLFKDPNLPQDMKIRIKNGETVCYETSFDFEKVKARNLYNTNFSGRIDLDVHISPIFSNELLTLLGYVVHVQDITERKKRQLELMREKYLFETLINGMPCVAMLLNPKTREIITSNKHAVDVGAIPGKICYETWGQCQNPCSWCLAPKAWKSGKEQHLEVEVRNIIWDMYWIPISDDLCLHFAFDVTQRKRTEEAIRYHIDFERLISEISSQFINLNPGQIDSQINHAVKKIAIFTQSDSGYVFRFDNEGSYFSMTHLWISDKLKTDKANLQNLDSNSMPWWMNQLRSGQIVAVPSIRNLPQAAHIEKKILQAQNNRSIIDVPMIFEKKVIGFLGMSSLREGRVWTNEEKNLLQLVGQIFSNALHRKKTEEIRLELEQRRENFVWMTNHELRTPLTVISGYTDFLLKNINQIDHDQQNKILVTIQRNINRLMKLTEQVAKIAQFKNRFFELKKVEFNICIFILEALKPYKTILKDQIDFKGCSIKTPVIVEGDKDRLLQVLDNLLDNAVKHTHPDNKLIKVNLEILANSILIKIIDNGAGIDQKNLKLIFEQFVSIETRYSVTGTGIGLYVSQKIIEAHKGTIIAQSEGVGRGATFTIELPR